MTAIKEEKAHPHIQAFKDFLQRDRQYIKPWMVSWAYQEQRKRRSKHYDEGLPQDFYEFSGMEDLSQWVNWNLSFPHPDYFLGEAEQNLVDLSTEVDMEVFRQAGIQVDEKEYREIIGRRNMQDYKYANFYPVPERQEPKRVLDFGSGYGRQANLWTNDNQDISFLSMDGIPKAYCIQRYYYSKLNAPVFEYMDNPDKFSIDFQPGIFHFPTWRFDLIPDNSLDMVLCIQVLPELSTKLAKYVLAQFHRVLKPGGAMMLRDMDNWLRTGAGFDLDKYLVNHGWVLEFKPHVIHATDIYSYTRIWRKVDPRVATASTYTLNQKLFRLAAHLDNLSGGFLGKIGRKLFK